MTDPPQSQGPEEPPPNTSVPPAREQGDRFREGDDPLHQLQEIEQAQQEARQGKRRVVIDSIEKSRQRVKTKLRQIRRLDDLDPVVD